MTKYHTEEAVTIMLCITVHKLQAWRVLNSMMQVERYGPPYVHIGEAVMYPKEGFTQWCRSVRKVNGVPCMNLAVPLPGYL